MLKLYNSKETNFEHNGLGILRDATNAKVTEEQNGIFELEFTYRVGSFLYSNLDYDMIIKADASPSMTSQLFRIYYISKELSGNVEIKAQHISYDLLDNFVENINLSNVTCEYALNKIFSSCTEENNFKGYSDILNSQNYSIECMNAYEAIKGTRGSIVDTFGLGAKIKRDNFDIHILNTRGESNNVLIAYKKNIKGLESSIDTQNVVTKIYPFAMADEENEDTQTKQVKITLPEKYIESKNINNYARQKIKVVDFTNDTIKTEEQLRAKAKSYFNDKKNLPLVNYKIEFIELSKTENYKGYKILEDINIDDEVIVRDFRLGINATTRVVKTEYDSISKKYISIELGQLVNHWKDTNNRLDKVEEDLGDMKDEIDNLDPSVDNDNFPDTLPNTPVLKASGLFATVQLEWTYENKMYYNYEIYASQIRGFTPDIFNYTNRIYEGKASAFLHEVKPVQTWYYKVRAGNTHENYTEFSTQVEATTRKLSDASEYFEEAAINHALIGSLDVDKVVAGRIKGTYIDAKNLTVTDGNNKRTLDIDSFGNVSMDVANLKISSKSVATNEIVDKVDKKYAEILLTPDGIISRVERVEVNLGNVKNDFQGQIDDVDSALKGFETTVNGVFKDGIIDEAEKGILSEKVKVLDKEKKDIDVKYESLYNDTNLLSTEKNELKVEYDKYVLKHDELENKINSVISDNMVNDVEKLEVDNLFKEYGVALANIGKSMNKAMERISTNKANAELNKAKEDIQKEITDINGKVDDLGFILDNAFKDGILSDAEKLSIKQSLQSLSNEKVDIDKQYETVYANVNLIDPSKANLKIAYDNYVLKYNALVTTINNILNKEGLLDNTDQTNLDNAFSDHRTTLGTYSQRVNEALDSITKKVAEDTSNKVDKKYAEILLTPDGIISRVERVETETGENGDKINKAESSITQLADRISSKVSAGEVSSIIQQSPNEIKYGFNNISDYVVINTNGLTVNRGSIACDSITTPSGHYPIIRLFGDSCSIDATHNYGAGKGEAIRLKYDDDNYLKVNSNGFAFYTSSTGGTNPFNIRPISQNGATHLLLGRDGSGYLKLLGSGDGMQVRNQYDTDYANMRVARIMCKYAGSEIPRSISKEVSMLDKIANIKVVQELENQNNRNVSSILSVAIENNTPSEIINYDLDGDKNVDLYSMVCMQNEAIKELTAIMKAQQKEIVLLKESMVIR